MKKLVSIFTPSHNLKWIKETWESVKAQTYENWEWIILLNGEATKPENNKVIYDIAKKDKRVKIFIDEYEGPNKIFIGRLKSECCKHCSGELYLELDHDDHLTPDCIEEAIKVYDKDVSFIYGNSVNVNVKTDENGIETYSGRTWSKAYGREFRPYTYRGTQVWEAVSAGPYPQNFSRIRFAANHPRFLSASHYKSIGGYDESMQISDDHDIIQRLYLVGKMIHINKPLTIYNVTGDNTRLKYMKEIDQTMWEVHDKFFEKCMMKWSAENKLSVLDLGGAIDCPEGYHSVDRHEPADLVFDLNGVWELESDSVGLLRCHDVMEHIKDKLHFFKEAYRVLAHGGIMDILVPSDCGIFINGIYYPPYGANSDFTHCSYWNKRSFRYVTEKNMRKFLEPELNEVKFTIIKPAEEILMRDNIPYVKITLMAEKGGQRFYGANDRR